MTRTELCAAGWLSTTIVISHTVKHTPVPILSFMLMLMMILIPIRPKCDSYAGGGDIDDYDGDEDDER